MPRTKKPAVLDANRTVTVTILARHAYNLAAYCEKARMDHFRQCGEEGNEALKEILSGNANEWGRTSEALATAYRESLAKGGPE